MQEIVLSESLDWRECAKNKRKHHKQIEYKTKHNIEKIREEKTHTIIIIYFVIRTKEDTIEHIQLFIIICAHTQHRKWQ